MATRTEQIRTLAKLIHDIRPDWHTNGIIRVLEMDDRPLGTLRDIALAAAKDTSARGPGVIATRDESTPVAPVAAGSSAPPPVGQILSAPKQPDEVAHRGAQLARAEIKKWKDADDW